MAVSWIEGLTALGVVEKRVVSSLEARAEMGRCPVPHARQEGSCLNPDHCGVDAGGGDVCVSEDGVLVVDETGHLKKGRHSVGAAH